MRYVLVQSRGHDEERLYSVPDELYEEIKAFDKKWGVWSDCRDEGTRDPETKNLLLIEKMAPYEVTDVLNVCEYC